MALESCGGHFFCLQTIPVLTDTLAPGSLVSRSYKVMFGHFIAIFGSQVSRYSVAVYGFNSGYSLPQSHTTFPAMDIVLAADATQIS